MESKRPGFEGLIYVTLITETALQNPEKRALTCLTDNVSFTYGEFDKITNKLGNKFRELKLQKDDVVSIFLLNTWQFPVSYVAAWKVPCIIAPMNFRSPAGDLAYMLEDSKTAVFIWDKVFDKTIKEALEISKHKPKVLLCTKKGSDVPGAVFFEDYYKDASDQDPGQSDRIEATVDPLYDATTRPYTSGTTGRPKSIFSTFYSYFMQDIQMFGEGLMHEDDVSCSFAPAFHQGGMPMVSTGLATGAHVVMTPLAPFNPDSFLDIAEKYKISVLMGPPVLLDSMSAAQQKKPRNLFFRIIYSVGAPFSGAQYIQWRDNLKPVDVCNCFGTSETRGDAFGHSSWHDYIKNPGCAGKVPRFKRTRLIQVRQGERVEPHELIPKDGKTVGQIISKGLGNTTKYTNNPAATEHHYYKGWFYTGDMATWNAEGYITIAGRTDDMICSGAEKVYPIPVEEALLRHPKVKDVFVVPMPHPKWQQVVVAYILPKEGETITVDELDEHCIKDAFLPNYYKPRYYQFVKELPYTATGKKQHYIMAKRAAEETDKFIPISSEKK
ncbi:MAG: class I adenylate-forming enzyme family protein [Smithellaceae bacterium]